MTKVISSTDARQNWDDIITAANAGDDVIVESNGAPRAVVISPEAFQELQQAREKQRRAEVLERLMALQRRQAERNKDLSPEQVEEIAVRVGREINAAVAKRHQELVERNRHP